MIMADVMLGTMLHVGLLLFLSGMWLLSGALWPSALGRAQQGILKRPIATFFIGLGLGLFIIFVTAVLGSANLPVLAVPIAVLGLGWAIFGMSAIARHVGERLPLPLRSVQ